ncbi:MAG TPA: GNAT family N-acetyltransferase [Microscillaceae bacterium]|nr:GNAT family N-acetyltransferase [Microscillaceae bacterium]
MNIQLALPQPNETVPYDLLLMADPDQQKIDTYLRQGQLYLAKTAEDELVGACVVQEIAPKQWEILNIAVSQHYHNQGIGQQIMAQVVAQARLMQIQQLWVATANSSIGQLAFYQKCGFEMQAIVHNFFVEYYPEPIIENGIVAKHQVRLLMNL